MPPDVKPLTEFYLYYKHPHAGASRYNLTQIPPVLHNLTVPGTKSGREACRPAGKGCTVPPVSGGAGVPRYAHLTGTGTKIVP